MVCREEQIQIPETAYEKAFYGKTTYCGKTVSWMEHEARRRGVHIHHQICGHGRERVFGERVFAGYPVGDFCLETWIWPGCHITALERLSKVVSKTPGRFRKKQARKRKIDKRFAACTNGLSIYRVRFRGVAGRERTPAGDERPAVLKQARACLCFFGRHSEQRARTHIQQRSERACPEISGRGSCEGVSPSEKTCSGTSWRISISCRRISKS